MKKLAVCLAALLVFGLMGFGFAMWADTVSVAYSSDTGNVEIAMVTPVTNGDGFQDIDGDQTSDVGLANVRDIVEGKNVGSTDIQLVDTDDDDNYDTLEVTVNNAYPCYYNNVGWHVQSLGSIPVILQRLELEWMGTTQEILQSKIYVLCEDGTIAGPFTDPADYPADAVIEIRYMNGYRTQLHEGDKHEESFEFHVLQPAQQGRVGDNAYQFSLTAEAIQWNESPAKPGVTP